MKFKQYLVESKPEIVLLIGQPASGKSTYVDKLIKKKKYIIISNDVIVMKVAKKHGISYDKAFRKTDYDKQVKPKTLAAFNKALESNENIIIDNTNLIQKQRLYWLNKTPSNYVKIAVVFEIDEKERLKRLKSRKEKKVPENIGDLEPIKKSDYDRVIYK